MKQALYPLYLIHNNKCIHSHVLKKIQLTHTTTIVFHIMPLTAPYYCWRQFFYQSNNPLHQWSRLCIRCMIVTFNNNQLCRKIIICSRTLQMTSSHLWSTICCLPYHIMKFNVLYPLRLPLIHSNLSLSFKPWYSIVPHRHVHPLSTTSRRCNIISICLIPF